MLRELLDSAGATYQQSRSKRNEVTLCCPFCEERGERADDRFRLGLNVELGMGHCFNCDWRSGSYSFTLRELCRVYGIRRKLRAPEEEEKEKPEPRPVVTGLPVGYERFVASGDYEEQRARDYLKQRGVDRYQIKRHQIGYAECGPFAGRVIFPVLGNKNKVYGCVTRAIRSAVTPKYLNTPGIKMLWNGYRPAKTAIVVEGVMDALAVERACATEWIHTDSVAVARLGSTITKVQLQQLEKYEKIVIFPDYDAPGVLGARELAAMLPEGSQGPYMVIPPGLDDSDPGSKSAQEIIAAIGDAKLWSKATDYRLRVAASKHV